MNPRLGDHSTCRSCGKPITFKGTYWNHDEGAFRHPAVPLERIKLKPTFSDEQLIWYLRVRRQVLQAVGTYGREIDRTLDDLVRNADMPDDAEPFELAMLAGVVREAIRT